MTLVEKVAKAIGEIPVNSPNYLFVSDETLQQIVSSKLLTRIAEVAIKVIEDDQRGT